MLLSHLNAIEKVLIAQSATAQNAGHPNLRGGPREWFIRDFLQSHLPTNLEIGQGEIIDEDSKPEPPKGRYRNQVDIVLYRRDFPRITYSRNNAAFLVEGVIATIESKSVLTKNELKKACIASLNHKNLKRNTVLHSFGQPDGHLISYVVAFACNQSIINVGKWLREISSDLDVADYKLPDVIIVLGKGVIWNHKAFKLMPELVPPEGTRWAFLQQAEKNLFLLFMHMLTWVPYISVPPSPLGYVSELFFETYNTIK
jgi:hypothetical protein